MKKGRLTQRLKCVRENALATRYRLGSGVGALLFPAVRWKL